ncbi:hypothetical protein PMAYCL1PPCAC_11613, partial [Pristionchus mayeri]
NEAELQPREIVEWIRRGETRRVADLPGITPRELFIGETHAIFTIYFPFFPSLLLQSLTSVLNFLSIPCEIVGW